MMPMSPDTLHRRGLLFDLTKPVTMSPEVFDKIWPYVDSVYTRLQQELLQQNGTVRVQKYECRLRKSKKPGVHQQKRLLDSRILWISRGFCASRQITSRIPWILWILRRAVN